jgi:murein DD-endopeptidase MepM/ murein hydrolase activator NlpD
MRKQLVLFVILSLFLFSCNHKKTQEKKPVVQTVQKDTIPEECINPVAIEFLGIGVDTLCVKEKEFSKRDNLQKLFRTLKLDKYQYAQFLADTKEYTDFTNIKPKQKYFTITKETDSTTELQYLVFKLSDFEYVIANCTDTTNVQFNKEPETDEPSQPAKNKKKNKKKNVKKVKPIYYHPLQISFYERNIDTTEIKFAAVIQKSVSKTFKDNNLDQNLIEKLNKAYNGKFSLNNLRKGDTLQFIYDQLSINGRFLDYGHVQAICCKSRKKSYYAVDYFINDDSSYQYVDDKGKYLKTAFIKSPLQKGGAIVSRYNLHRFHPILQVEKAHLGTDFAAPIGAPIVATASGIVEAAQFTQYNGNYVKIRHDRMYETQYLHMSRFARGMRNGVRVQQGQVIGYVGSTGLATGPHVCYRFWKNGQQVDPLKEKLNVIKQIPKDDLENYEQYFSTIQSQLNTILVK